MHKLYSFLLRDFNIKATANILEAAETKQKAEIGGRF
jgi:hypothetical protein